MSEIVELKVVPTRRDDMLARIVAEIYLAHPDDRRELAYSLGQSLIDLAFRGTTITAAGIWGGGEITELTILGDQDGTNFTFGSLPRAC